MSEPLDNSTPVPTSNATYPATETMTTAPVDSQPKESQTEQQTSMLRLRGGGGCITNCLAAIGCCCICEECCC
ncbi:hypothetical protein BD560DRAFT_406855 [Blakeslea trispora]|nr:hypothetical protein BD560DRAFT_406855 [Blakeslea trispora]